MTVTQGSDVPALLRWRSIQSWNFDGHHCVFKVIWIVYFNRKKILQLNVNKKISWFLFCKFTIFTQLVEQIPRVQVILVGTINVCLLYAVNDVGRGDRTNNIQTYPFRNANNTISWIITMLFRRINYQCAHKHWNKI